MNGKLVGLGPVTWAQLVAIPVSEWLWLDMDGAGAHRAPSLTSERPAQITHAWGWLRKSGSMEYALRVRIDKDLPGEGIVGAFLMFGEDEDDGGTAGETVAIGSPRQVTGWGDKDGRVAADFSGSVAGFTEYVLWEVRRTRQASGNEVESSVLQFMAATHGNEES